MSLLWAPWRMEYIEGGASPGGCIFCDRPREGPENHRKNLILAETAGAFVMMNRFPYAYAHLMIVPRAHVAAMEALDAAAFAGLWDLVRIAAVALKDAVSPHGMNLGMNLGRVAGAGIDQHLHVHIVPRWNGDTNFMPMLADCRVMPEHLDRTWDRLRPAFDRAIGAGKGTP